MIYKSELQNNNADLQTILNTINNLEDSGGVNISDATATAGDILDGKIAYNNQGRVTGTMQNNGAVSATLNAGESYTVPIGYHDGTGVVSSTPLSSQTVGDASESDITLGKIAWVNGVEVTGTLTSGVKQIPITSVSLNYSGSSWGSPSDSYISFNWGEAIDGDFKYVMLYMPRTELPADGIEMFGSVVFAPNLSSWETTGGIYCILSTNYECGMCNVYKVSSTNGRVNFNYNAEFLRYSSASSYWTGFIIV